MSSVTWKGLEGHGRQLKWMIDEEKKAFTLSAEVKNTLEKLGASLSKSTIKRHLHASAKVLEKRWKSLLTIKNRRHRLQTDSLPCSGIRSLFHTGLNKPAWEWSGEENMKKERRKSWSKVCHVMCPTWWRLCYGLGTHGCWWSGLTAVSW